MDVLSVFRGITTPIPELVKKLEEQGWELGQVQFKQGQFVAEASSPYGDKIQKVGPDEATAIGAVVLAVARKNHMRSHAMWKVGMWDTSWHDKLRDIADAYRSAPIYDPKAVAAYKVLGDDSTHRAEVLGQHLHIEPTNDPSPYASADDMRKDIHEKRHYYQSLYGLDHPVWTPQQHAAFRTVHDVLGHGVAGGQYDWPGRNLATAAHMPLLDPTAQQALFTEAIGRHAHDSVYGPGPHKVTILNDFIDGPIKDENPPGHWGVHPSQIIPPSAAPAFEHTAGARKLWVDDERVEPPGYDRAINVPQAKQMLATGNYDHASLDHDLAHYDETFFDPDAESGADLADWMVETGNVPPSVHIHSYNEEGADYMRQALAPHTDLSVYRYDPSRYLSKTAAVGSIDVNKDWSPNIEPLPVNAFADHGDPLQGKAVMDNASLIDTNWSNLKDGQGKDNRPMMKQAIVNAFRVVLLSPRKDLRWNAVHYQDISHIPGDEDNPKTYWDTLENSRQRWNQAQGIDPTAHMIYYKYLKPFASVIYARNPKLGPIGAQEEADKELFRWWTQEQERIMEEDAQKPEDKQKSADEIERRANEALARRLHQFLKPKDEKTDHLDDQMKLGATAPAIYEVNALKPGHPAFELRRPFIYDIDNHIVQIGPPGNKHDDIEHHAESDNLAHGYIDMDAKLVGAYDNDYIEDINEAIAHHMGWEHKPYDPFAGFKQGALSPEDQWKVYLEQTGRDPETPMPEKQKSQRAKPQQYNVMTGEESAKYGAFMGTHLKAISAISKHADEILDAALQDVREHDAGGHHFRHAVLSLGVSGVGPKVCSFAWLLLQPMTSQLGTIDTHMMDVLGHNYEKEMNNRDYFKFERELKAGRDSSGYSHIPLGAFQWGMWDYKRTGPGSHQDHSAMRVLDPKPHSEIDWVGKAQNLKGEAWHDQGPDWWQNTKEARDQVGDEWDKTHGKNFKSDQIPYVPATYAKVSADLGAMIPWFTHPMTGEQKQGAPGQTLMNHLRFHHPDLQTEDIWRQFADQHVKKRPANAAWDESMLLGADHSSIDPPVASDQNWTL